MFYDGVIQPIPTQSWFKITPREAPKTQASLFCSTSNLFKSTSITRIHHLKPSGLQLYATLLLNVVFKLSPIPKWVGDDPLKFQDKENRNFFGGTAV